MKILSIGVAVAIISLASISLTSISLAPHAAAAEGDESGGNKPEPVSQQPAALSVAPLGYLDYPLDRPNWIEEHRLPEQPSEGEDLLISVSSGPAASPEIAAEMMEVMAGGAVENYLIEMAQGDPDLLPRDPISVDMNWVREQLISRRYDGTVDSGGQVRYESAGLLRINREQQHRLQQIVQNQHLETRLSTVAAVAITGLIAMIGGATGLGWLASRQQAKPAVDLLHRDA
ncbi:hypothetical protein [Allorhodopirellula solitaria]|uniref:Uncharacterized protein n=1 Tax=Allorhodopirellula solitaria TaxID=2527987 RepID=A0A5C5XTZ5_9BACT|nr:hypothetical protein [Allorhodopirellula solitaria]TWT66029.1 hypothetical protein CA85_28900 [Allorhodopirellula solitaria]